MPTYAYTSLCTSVRVLSFFNWFVARQPLNPPQALPTVSDDLASVLLPTLLPPISAVTQCQKGQATQGQRPQQLRRGDAKSGRLVPRPDYGLKRWKRTRSRHKWKLPIKGMQWKRLRNRPNPSAPKRSWLNTRRRGMPSKNQSTTRSKNT